MVALLGVVLLAVAGCTTIGMHVEHARARHDFGPPATVRLCAYLDDGIGADEARTLVARAWTPEAPLYALEIVVVQTERWRRPAFTHVGILAALEREPMPPGCDRLLAFVGRHAGDYLWGLLGLPEVLGAVDDATMTRGFVVARWAGLNQLILSPAAIVRHELYHLLGCGHGLTKVRCYAQIAALKAGRPQSLPLVEAGRPTGSSP